jgi:hypothetical protein
MKTIHRHFDGVGRKKGALTAVKTPLLTLVRRSYYASPTVPPPAIEASVAFAATAIAAS